MALVSNTVAISFIPLLRDICCLLGIDQPKYELDGVAVGSVSVFVTFSNYRIEHIFHGFGLSFEECCEMAARQMAIFLVQRLNVRVYDVNLALRARNEHCAQMYCCKYDYYSRIKLGLSSPSMYGITPVEGIDCGALQIDINFIELLDKVVQKFQFGVTPMTVEYVVPGCFLAWFTIPVPGSISPSHGVMGYKTTTIDAAKQTLAKEALTLMSMWYRFEIQDVNYYLLAQSSHLMEAGRGVYERIRQRVHGIDECREPVPYVVEQDCTTPRGKRNRIPEPQHPPPPPNRARMIYDGADLATGTVHECPSPDTFSL